MAKPHGLAALRITDPKKVHRIATLGGQASGGSVDHYRLTSEKAREIGRKGGKAVSENRKYMAKIGRKGGRRSKGRKKAL